MSGDRPYLATAKGGLSRVLDIKPALALPPAVSIEALGRRPAGIALAPAWTLLGLEHGALPQRRSFVFIVVYLGVTRRAARGRLRDGIGVQQLNMAHEC